MKKCDIPKPKFDLDNVLVFKVEQPTPIKGVGTVSEIAIILKPGGVTEVNYMFREHDGLLVKESDVVKRVSV